MWTTPSVVSILARWLPSRTSSTISGWRSRRPADLRDLVAATAPARSTQTAAFGCAGSSGSAVSAAASVHSLPAPSTMAVTRRRPGPMPSVAGRVGRARRGHVRAAGSSALLHVLVPVRARSSSVAGVGRSDAIGSRLRVGRGPPGRRSGTRTDDGASTSDASRPPRRPPRTSDGGTASDHHAGRHHEQPDHDRRGLARRPLPPARRRPAGPCSGRSRSASGMNCQVGVGGRVDLGRQAVDGRRAVRGQDRQPDRHADHPRDGHDRRRGPERCAGPRPRPRRSSAA